jgi:hypothetical protein
MRRLVSQAFNKSKIKHTRQYGRLTYDPTYRNGAKYLKGLRAVGALDGDQFLGQEEFDVFFDNR